MLKSAEKSDFFGRGDDVQQAQLALMWMGKTSKVFLLSVDETMPADDRDEPL